MGVGGPLTPVILEVFHVNLPNHGAFSGRDGGGPVAPAALAAGSRGRTPVLAVVAALRNVFSLA